MLVPKGHEWTTRKAIPFSDLEGQSLVTVSPEAAPAFNLWLQDLFVQAGIRPLFVQRADRARAVCSMAAVSGTLALLIKSACHPMDSGKALPVTDPEGKPITLTLVLAHRPTVQEHVEGLLSVAVGPATAGPRTRDVAKQRSVVPQSRDRRPQL